MFEKLLQILEKIPPEYILPSLCLIMLGFVCYLFMLSVRKGLDSMENMRKDFNERVRRRDEELKEFKEKQSEDLDDLMEILRDVNESLVRVTERIE